MANGILKEQQEAEAAIRQLRATIQAADAELNGLKEKRNQIQRTKQEASSQRNVLSSLLNAQKQGQLSGVHGRLGDLGEIDSQYDVAVSSAG